MGACDLDTSVINVLWLQVPFLLKAVSNPLECGYVSGNCIKIRDFRSRPAGSRVVPIFYREHASRAVEHIGEPTRIANSASTYHGLHELEFLRRFRAEKSKSHP